MRKQPEDAKLSSNLTADLTLEVSHLRNGLEAFKQQIEAMKVYQTQLAVILVCTVESMKLQSETGVLFASPTPQSSKKQPKRDDIPVPGLELIDVPFNIAINPNNLS